MWQALIGPVFSLGKQWLENKQEKSKAKHQAELNRIYQDGAAETSLIAQMATSWKDEYWTLVVSTPVLAIMYGVATDNDQIIARVRDGMTALESMPTWFQLILSVAVLTSFGVKVRNNLFKAEK